MRRESHVRFCEGPGVRFPRATRLVMGFVRKQDAECVLALLRERMAAFGLVLHPDKTRLVPFRPPDRGHRGGNGPGTFDFLGFTLYWMKTRKGGWRLGMRTRKACMHRAIKAIGDWCRSHRHEPLKQQHASLKRRLDGHYDYFGVNGNITSLDRLLHLTVRIWHKWLTRRSQRGRRLRWARFKDLLKVFPLPTPSVFRVRSLTMGPLS